MSGCAPALAATRLQLPLPGERDHQVTSHHTWDESAGPCSSPPLSVIGLAHRLSTRRGGPRTRSRHAPVPHQREVRVPCAQGKLHGIDRSTARSRRPSSSSSGEGSGRRRRRPRPGPTPTKVQGASRERRPPEQRVLATAKAEDTRAARLYTTANAIPGLAIRARPGRHQGRRSAVRRRQGLEDHPKHLTNANTAALTRRYDTWKYAGDLGKGVKIGVIDTGIDYTHTDFGGVGTVAAYDAAKAASTSPDLARQPARPRQGQGRRRLRLRRRRLRRERHHGRQRRTRLPAGAAPRRRTRSTATSTAPTSPAPLPGTA